MGNFAGGMQRGVTNTPQMDQAILGILQALLGSPGSSAGMGNPTQAQSIAQPDVREPAGEWYEYSPGMYVLGDPTARTYTRTYQQPTVWGIVGQHAGGYLRLDPQGNFVYASADEGETNPYGITGGIPGFETPWSKPPVLQGGTGPTRGAGDVASNIYNPAGSMPNKPRQMNPLSSYVNMPDPMSRILR